jgi:hypothetical protein
MRHIIVQRVVGFLTILLIISIVVFAILVTP